MDSRAPSEPDANEVEEPLTHLRFVAGDRAYELPLSEVGEVAAIPSPVARIPRSRPPIRGAVNLRGRVVALVDLAGLLGRPADGAAPEVQRAVWLEGSALALVVDEVTGFAADGDLASPTEPPAPMPRVERLAAADLLAEVERLLHAAESGLGYLHLRSNEPSTRERPWPSAS